MERERRFKSFRVHEDLLVTALCGLGDGRPCPAYYVEGLPAGYKVDRVAYDTIGGFFRIRIYHDSFDVVGDFEPPQEIEVKFRERQHEQPRGRQFI